MDCRSVLEHIQHALMINNDEKCMLVRVEGNSRSRKLDEWLINQDYSWIAFWSRPQADDKMPLEPYEGIKCHESVGKGHCQLTRCAAERNSLTSARAAV